MEVIGKCFILGHRNQEVAELEKKLEQAKHRLGSIAKGPEIVPSKFAPRTGKELAEYIAKFSQDEAKLALKEMEE